jgi:predicted ester cyclase
VPADWEGTRIIASLEARSEGVTRLRFAHEGWRPNAQSFAKCNTTWGELMHRLRDVAEAQHPGPLFTQSARATDGRQLVRELYARLMARGDVAAGHALLADDYVDHNIPGFGTGGRKELISAVLAVRAAFPDIRPVLHEILHDGPLVAVRVVARGHHTGKDFMNFPASGTAIEWNEVHVFRHGGGRILEHWGVFDLLNILEQLKTASQQHAND